MTTSQGVHYYHDPDGKLMALVINANFQSEGINFFTDNDSLQQIAYMNHKEGHKIVPHVHNPINRNITYTCETLVIRKGRLKVTLFYNQQPLNEFEVQSGDVLSLFSGGHGFEVVSEVDMIEIKQGPYLGEKDKTRF